MKIDLKTMEKIWSDYKVLGNYKNVALLNGVSVYIAKKAVERFKKLQLEEKNDTVRKYMDTKRQDAFDFITKCMSIMADDEKLEKASVNQIASAMGVVIDKFAKNASDDGSGQLDEILKAVRKIE